MRESSQLLARTRATCLVAGFAGFLVAAPAGAAVIDNIVFAYDFEGAATGTGVRTIPDISGNNRNGTTTSGLTIEAAGAGTASPVRPSSTRHLQTPNPGDASNPQRIDTGARLTTASAGLSFSLFYNARGDVEEAVRLLSTFSGGGAVTADQFLFDRLEIASLTATPRNLRVIANGASHFSTVQLPAIDTGWHQLAFVFTDLPGTSNGKITFYFDGNPLGADVATTFDAVPVQARNWHLVEDPGLNGSNPKSDSEYFDNGDNDEAALWYRALSGDEMSSVFTQGITALVPEPASLSLLAAGLLLARRRR